MGLSLVCRDHGSVLLVNTRVGRPTGVLCGTDLYIYRCYKLELSALRVGNDGPCMVYFCLFTAANHRADLLIRIDSAYPNTDWV